MYNGNDGGASISRTHSLHACRPLWWIQYSASKKCMVWALADTWMCEPNQICKKSVYDFASYDLEFYCGTIDLMHWPCCVSRATNGIWPWITNGRTSRRKGEILSTLNGNVESSSTMAYRLDTRPTIPTISCKSSSDNHPVSRGSVANATKIILLCQTHTRALSIVSLKPLQCRNNSSHIAQLLASDSYKPYKEYEGVTRLTWRSWPWNRAYLRPLVYYLRKRSRLKRWMQPTLFHQWDVTYTFTVW